MDNRKELLYKAETTRMIKHRDILISDLKIQEENYNISDKDKKEQFENIKSISIIIKNRLNKYADLELEF